MIVKVNRILFLDALIKAGRIATYKTNIPILQGIMLDVKKDRMVLVSSDGSTSFKIELLASHKVQINSIGSLLIKNKQIIEIVKKMEDEYINLESVESSVLRIKGDKFDLNFNTLNAVEFPDIDFETKGVEINFNSKELIKAVNQTAFAIDPNENNVIFTGLNIKSDIENNKVVFSSTNVKRLAYKETYSSQKNNFNIIVPLKFISDVAKLIENVEKVSMFLEGTGITFAFNNSIIKSKLIEGSYPDISSVIKMDTSTNILVNRQKIIKVMDRASVFSVQDEQRTNVVILNVLEDKLNFSSYAKETGQSEEIVDNVKINGKPIKIYFNSKYFLDAIRAFEYDNIIISFTDENGPIIISSKEEEELHQVVLPIKSY
ncbi:DNA polymerase III subunit beta [Spiroplasma endosymbiont of Anurida maritima]|uniref:DNA polymerase III subunit beta n=1 Tax=Spiroplasma endosymbiont of Anurida maritima TaxID=2967972 RepID=UPI0036D24D89